MRFAVAALTLMLASNAYAQDTNPEFEALSKQIVALTKTLSEHIAKDEVDKKQLAALIQQQAQKKASRGDRKKLRKAYEDACAPFKYVGFNTIDNKPTPICR